MNQTLEYFLEGTGTAPIAGLRQRMVQRLIRMKALDAARLQGRFVVLIDGSGYLVLQLTGIATIASRSGTARRRCTCTRCWRPSCWGRPARSSRSPPSSSTTATPRALAAGASQEQVKQDCELKALRRLLAKLRAEFPQMRLCLNGDGLYACGEGFQVAKDYQCDYIYVFKPGRLPALWEDFQGLLRLCPEQQVVLDHAAGDQQVYRWVEALRLHRQRWSRLDLRRP